MDGQTETPEPQGQTEVQGSEPTEVQPDAGSPDPSQTSQGLIEPYLENLDPSQRDVVAPVLERFRADQDARVNQKIQQEAERRKAYEQYGEPEQVRVATQVMNSFIADPVATTKWLAEQAKDEFGIDIINDLSSEMDVVQREHEASGSDEPLTPEKIVEIIEQREQAKQQEQRRNQTLQQQQEQAAQRAITWFEDSVQRHSIPADSLTDGLKQAMFTRANQIKQQGLAADGRTAIDMAVSEIGQAFSKANGSQPAADPEPTVAQGGTAPPGQSIDVTNDRQRKQAMLDHLMAATGASE